MARPLKNGTCVPYCFYIFVNISVNVFVHLPESNTGVASIDREPVSDIYFTTARDEYSRLLLSGHWVN